MLRLTALGGRVAAIGLSGAVHAALFLTPPGHPSPSGRAAAEWTLDVSLEATPPEPAPAPTPEPSAVFENHAVAVPTHTHPYPVSPSHDWIPHDPSLVHPDPHDEPDHDPTPRPAPSAPESVADTRGTLTAEGYGPRFSMVLAAGGGFASGVASAASGGHGAGHADDDDGAPVPERSVDQRARLVHGATPAYPMGAREEGVEASVRLELVVSPAGAVEQVRVLRPAGHGLDEAAVAAAHHFHFTPAVRLGRPVRVRMPWSVEFRLD